MHGVAIELGTSAACKQVGDCTQHAVWKTPEGAPLLVDVVRVRLPIALCRYQLNNTLRARRRMPCWSYLGVWLSLSRKCSGILMHHVYIPWGCQPAPSHIKLEAQRVGILLKALSRLQSVRRALDPFAFGGCLSAHDDTTCPLTSFRVLSPSQCESRACLDRMQLPTWWKCLRLTQYAFTTLLLAVAGTMMVLLRNARVEYDAPTSSNEHVNLNGIPTTCTCALRDGSVGSCSYCFDMQQMTRSS